ncbi:MAG: AI-2E family transporter [Bacteroidota bacterium]
MSSPTQQTIDTALKLAFLAAIIAISYLIVSPFGSIMVWSIILAMAYDPLYFRMADRFGGNFKLSAIIVVLLGILTIVVPAWLFMESIVEGVKVVRTSFGAGTLTIPEPKPSVEEWPFIGESLYENWHEASDNLQGTIVKYQHQLGKIGNSLLKGLLSVVSSVLQFVVATIIAGILLVTKGTKESSIKLFNKLMPHRGDEVAEIAQKTVNNVVKGVLGVAMIQSFLLGVGMLLAGIPYAGLWTLLIFFLAVLQMPVMLVTIPVIIYLFATVETLPAVLWTIYLMVTGLSDNVLKPLLLGQGAPVPMLVIFLGVLGGFISMGFIGLFIGAIMLSLAYRLYLMWVNAPSES